MPHARRSTIRWPGTALAIFAAVLLCACGDRALPPPDAGLSDATSDAQHPPDAALSDGLPCEAILDLSSNMDAGLDALPQGCVNGSVRLAPTISCAKGDPFVDCFGHLCVDLLLVTAPGVPLARACYPKTDLAQGAIELFTMSYDLAQAPPGTELRVGAFLAEANPAATPKTPVPGDPWRSVPRVAYATTAYCLTIELVLDKRY